MLKRSAFLLGFVMLFMLFSSNGNAAEQKKAVVYYFYYDSCPVCQSMRSTVSSISNTIKSEYDDLIEWKNIDCRGDSSIYKPLAVKFGVNTVPAIVFVNAGGKVIWRNSGAIDASRILEQFSKAGIQRVPANPLNCIKIGEGPFHAGKDRIFVKGIPAGKIEAKVKNEQGSVVKELSTTGVLVCWDLKDSKGSPVDPGKYILEFNNSKDNSKEFTVAIN